MPDYHKNNMVIASLLDACKEAETYIESITEKLSQVDPKQWKTLADLRKKLQDAIALVDRMENPNDI